MADSKRSTAQHRSGLNTIFRIPPMAVGGPGKRKAKAKPDSNRVLTCLADPARLNCCWDATVTRFDAIYRWMTQRAAPSYGTAWKIPIAPL